jgi:predicted transcriptional regulator
MRKRSVPELGPLEFKLLRIVWGHEALTAPQVLEEYNERAETPLAYTTVMTLLGRMAEKGVLKVNRERQPYRFSAAVSRERMLRQRVSDFVNNFFDGSPQELVMRLIEEMPPSDDSVQMLEEVLREHKSRKKRKSGA